MSHTLKWLVGQFGGVQRSLIFIYVELEQGPNSLYIAPDRHTRQAINQTCSSRKAIFLIFTSTALDGRPALKLTIRNLSPAVHQILVCYRKVRSWPGGAFRGCSRRP
jgi:hypothetical protein